MPGLMPAAGGRSDAGECPGAGLDSGTVIMPGNSLYCSPDGGSRAEKHLLC